MTVAISGGAGFLGLHLARHLRDVGEHVRTLDLVPLDSPELEIAVEQIRGDVRDPLAVRRLVRGAEVVVHAAAALPIQASRESIFSINVDGAANVLAAALEAGVRRVVLISSTAVYGIPNRHPIVEDDPLVGVGWYGESKIRAERICREFEARGLDVVIVRPKTFVGPERLGVFEILFDWLLEGRRIYTLGSGDNRYQLLAVEDLVDAIAKASRAPDVAGEAFNIGGEGLRHRSRRSAGARRSCWIEFAADARPDSAWRSSCCGLSSFSGSRRSPSGTTRRRTRIRSSPPRRRSGCSAGNQRSRMRRH